jgi:hypothetical protein
MSKDIIIIPHENNPDENKDALIQDQELLFTNMRQLAFAQLNANFSLGFDASPDQKDEYVKNFAYGDIDPEEINELMPSRVFEQYFNMLKEKEEFEGCPVIKELSLMEAVDKLIYYGMIKTYSQLHDQGVVDMFCSPDGNISFAPKGQKPKFPKSIKKSAPIEGNTARVKFVKPKKPNKKKPISKKKPTKKAPKKPKRKDKDSE